MYSIKPMPQVINHPTYKPSTDGLCLSTAAHDHDLHTCATEEREETSTTRIRTQLNRTLETTAHFENSSGYFGTNLCSQESERNSHILHGDDDCKSIDFNYDDLTNAAQLISPKVTSLIKASEALFESTLLTNEESPPDVGNACSSDNEDSIGSELERLADAEQLLRDELDLSNMGFNFLMNRNEEDMAVSEATSENSDTEQMLQGTTGNASFTSLGVSKGNTAAEKLPKDYQEDVHLETKLQEGQSTTRIKTNTGIEREEKETITATPESNPSFMKSYTLFDHAIEIGLLYDDEDLGYPTSPLLTESDADIIYNTSDIRDSKFDDSVREEAIRDLLKCTREYVEPMARAPLSRIYTGLAGDKSNYDMENEKDESVPVRTAAIEIRPDVLVDEVMDAIKTSVTSLHGKITTQQKGHLRSLIPGRWIEENEYASFRTIKKEKGVANSTSKMVFLPPIAVDVQLCTRKRSRFAQRILLVRSYSINDTQILDDGAELNPSHLSSLPNNNLCESASLHQRIQKAATVGGIVSFGLKDDPEERSLDALTLGTDKKRSNSHKRSAFFNLPSKGVSQMHSKCNEKQNTSSIRLATIESKEDPQILVSDQPLSKFTENLSVLDDSIDPISTLSHLDWPYIQSTWRLLITSLTELEKGKLSQSSLLSCAFGASPSLPTLDVHYCYQLKELCKETMIAKLLTISNELEAYAKEAEYGCATLKQVLEPMVFSYQKDLAKFPEIIPLNAYQLDYIVPEISSPPWGQRVGESLKLIGTQSRSQSSNTDMHNRSENEFQRAREAVALVITAFRKQFDEELSAKIGWRNCHVMDRLAKSQSYMSKSITSVKGSYGKNTLATKAADKFHAYARDCARADMESQKDSQLKIKILPASDQVPLLSCRVIVGGLGAMCYVTYHQLLLVSKRLPFVRGSSFSLVLLKDIEIEVKISSKKSRLNLVPSMVVVKNKNDGKEICSFRPATGAHLFKDFVDIVKKYTQSPDTVSFAPKLQMIAEYQC